MAHELGHLYQDSIAQYQGRSLDMRTVSEGTATYIGGRATGTAGTFYTGPLYGYSLNDPVVAYTSWLFFESLAMDHGTTIIPELYQEIGQGAEPLPALDAVLGRRGSSLSAAYATFALRHAAGTWGPTVAKVPLLEPARATKLPRKTPKKPVDLRPADVTVNHLGTGLVRYEPGRAAKSCKSGKLAITVELPSGAATPTLVTRPEASSAPPFATRQFALKGGDAVTKLKWAACKNVGTVVLPNPSTSVDGQRFEVTAEFTPPKR